VAGHAWGDEIGLRELQALHEGGYARADHIIAMSHHHGLGVPRDHVKAASGITESRG